MNTNSMFNKKMAGIYKEELMNIYSMFDKWMAGIYRKKGWISIVCLINEWILSKEKMNEYL